MHVLAQFLEMPHQYFKPHSLTEAMLFEHMLAMVLDMINRCKYLPELIVVHIGASDFSSVTNHQIRVNIQNMVLSCKKMTVAACETQTCSEVLCFC